MNLKILYDRTVQSSQLEFIKINNKCGLSASVNIVNK